MSRFLRRRSTIDLEKDDPLAKAMAPPDNETPKDKQARLLAQAEAQRRSDEIDEEINRQRIGDRKKCVRVLLLGQSESGKSTTLKNFQLINSPKAFRNERASWRAVVQLNVVRSVRFILDAITEAHSSASRPSTSAIDRPSSLTITTDLLKLRMRLLPLQQVEESLFRKMTPVGSAEFEATHLSRVPNLPHKNFREFAINSATQWKGAFGRLVATARASLESTTEIDFEDPNDPGVILHACSEDITKLWNDPTVKILLKAQKIRLEDMGGFFLDSIERVTALKYIPTDDDILRARLKTLGISEHRFTLMAGSMLSHDWRIYDVGGARSLVRLGRFLSEYLINSDCSPLPARSFLAAWAPYFENNLDAIIFLAPISGFDEVLLEDPSVNKLEDSILLWKHIIAHPLLQHTQIVLFLNKCDLLRAKLAAGTKFSEFVVSFGDRPNSYESVANYLRKKFAVLHKHQSPLPRIFYCHFTSVIDTKTTHHILLNVKDMVIRQNLQSSSLMA